MKAPSQMVLGDAEGALADCHKALVIFESLLAADPTNAEARRDLGYAHYMSGLVLEIKLGDIVGAVESYRKSLQIFEAMAVSDPANTENHADLVRGYERLGEILGKTGNTAGSIEHYRRAVMFYERYLAANPTNMMIRRNLATAYSKLGKVHAMLASDTKTTFNGRTNHWREARVWYQRSLDMWLDIRSRGKLMQKDASKPEEVGREIYNCDAAILQVR